MPQSRAIKTLLKKYSDEGPERVGFVVANGKVIEIDNISEDPNNSFDVSGDDLLKYEKIAIASWHTHPGASSNLSSGDMESFLSWPSIEHYIVGSDGVTCYVVEDGEVLVG